MATRVILTYRDYEALPADGRRYELHDGELSVTPAPAPRRQQVSGNLFAALRGHVEARGLGTVLYSPIDLILSDTSVVQPDLLYLRPEQLPAITDRGIETPPALVMEILSPGTVPRSTGVSSSSSTPATASPTTGSSTPRPGASRLTRWPAAAMS